MKIPCKYFKDPNVCTHKMQPFGKNPLEINCMMDCQYYEGPERTPELILLTTNLHVVNTYKDKSYHAQNKPNTTIFTGNKPKNPKYTIDNIKKYMKAEYSLLSEGPVSDKMYNERYEKCKNKKLDKDSGYYFCQSGCGCGKRARARLDVKLRMPKFTCKNCGIQEEAGMGKKYLFKMGGLLKQVRDIFKGFGQDIQELLKEENQEGE